MGTKGPVFSDDDTMARLITEQEVGPKGKPSPGAFMLAEGEDHLSINCTIYEKIGQIVDYYKEALQKGDSPARVSFHKVKEYLRVYTQQGEGKIFKDPDIGKYFNDLDSTKKSPFKHRPVMATTSRPGSPSHSGAEFMRTMEDIKSKRFARKMADKKYQEF